ncbi:MAG: penicillin-binding protein 2 [Deltaproteobacteria bacterium]|jgi:penicillin-binding protein 2|nr:penicillin-binding protein 2 [Deltaproteobacteria bacterium]
MKKALIIDTAMESKLIVSGAVVFAFLAILVIRLYYLQVIKGEYFKDLSENNRLRTVKILAPRGEIIDREGRLVVYNRPSFDVVLVLEDINNLDTLLESVAGITGLSKEELFNVVKSRTNKRERFEPQIIIQDADREQIAKLEANEYRLPGIIIEISPARIYPFKSLAAQLLGYVSEISANKLKERQLVGDETYKLGDLVGKSGIEAIWEKELRGIDGKKLVEVDAHGKRRKEVGKVDSISGKDIQLTLDVDLQRAAENALQNKVGAVVALDPNNGEVLALVSTPTYDLNMFSRSVSKTDWQALRNNPDKPMNNRAISGTYPSGSTIKLVETLAAVAENLPLATNRNVCPGYFQLGRRYACMKKEGHGSLNLQEALMTSCNVFFYQLALDLGIDRFYKYATALGLGSPTGINLPNESSGLFANREWKKNNFPNDPHWKAYDILPMAVGQGFLNVTPLQIAQMTATIVNGGRFYRPFLVKKIINTMTGEEQIIEPELIRTLDDIPANAFETVKAYASTVVNGNRGTGRRVRLPGIEVGGKTGTAQYKALVDNKKLNPEEDDHAWIVVFAPVQEPEIVVSVLVEHGGHGGSGAGPIAKQVLEMFFYKKGLLKELSNPLAIEKLSGKIEEDEEEIGFVELDDEL